MTFLGMYVFGCSTPKLPIHRYVVLNGIASLSFGNNIHVQQCR